MKEGWICPKCGRVYGPSTFECPSCNSRIGLKTLNQMVNGKTLTNGGPTLTNDEATS